MFDRCTTAVAYEYKIALTKQKVWTHQKLFLAFSDSKNSLSQVTFPRNSVSSYRIILYLLNSAQAEYLNTDILYSVL